MKLFVKLMIFMLVLAMVGPFIIKGPDGMPLLTLDDLNLELPSLSFTKPSPPPSEAEVSDGKSPEAWIQWADDAPKNRDIIAAGQAVVTEKEDVYYRWLDDNGVWQITKTPNPEKENIVVQVDTDANILQSLPVEHKDSEPDKEEPADTLSKTEVSAGFPTTVPITEIPKMIEDVKQLQQTAIERQKIMDKNL